MRSIFEKKQFARFFLLILLTNTLSLILFFAFKYVLFFDRPLLQLEYLLWLPLIYFFRKPWLVSFFISVFFLLDIFESLSTLFDFNLYDYLHQIGTLFRLRFAYLYISLFVFCMFQIFIISAFIKRKLIQFNFSAKQMIVGTMISIVCISTADLLNGSTNNNTERELIVHVNITSSFLFRALLLAKVHIVDTKTPLIDFNCVGLDSSVTFKQFYSSSRKKELLIIVESWGIYKNNIIMEEEFKKISSAFENNYTIHYGTSAFKGATMHGELRELYNKQGSPYNILQPNHFLSIADIKKRKGYFTAGMGGTFKYLMMQNPTWHTLHFDRAVFLNDFIAKDPKISFCYETAYLCIKDEEAFDSLCTIVKNKEKSFSYFLTTNTHLPFSLDLRNSDTTGFTSTKTWFTQTLKTDETFQQYFRFIQFFKHASQKAKENGFEKIVLVGDHRPPILDKNILNLYIADKVPYIVIEKKN